MRKVFKKILLVLAFMFFIISINSCKQTEILDLEIHTEAQISYLEGNYDLIRSYAKGDKELSKPKAIKISWDSSKDVKEFDFYLSKDADFKEYRLIETNIAQVELINLEIHTNYYWYVEYIHDQKKIRTEVETFRIDCHTPRNLDIDGITNARDLGGYKIGENKYTNQGLIYRTARFNEKDGTVIITEKGIKEMVEVLKVKTELDVRQTEDGENGGINSSPLGDSVNYISVPMNTGGNYLLLNISVLKDVFKVFGNEANYPIVLHCSIGTDRTGVISFLINALLGVAEEDLYKDYLFSMFGLINNNRMSSTIDKYIDMISTSDGSTLKEKTYNYLIDLGVEKADLDNLIGIMTN